MSWVHCSLSEYLARRENRESEPSLEEEEDEDDDENESNDENGDDDEDDDDEDEEDDDDEDDENEYGYWGEYEYDEEEEEYSEDETTVDDSEAGEKEIEGPNRAWLSNHQLNDSNTDESDPEPVLLPKKCCHGSIETDDTGCKRCFFRGGFLSCLWLVGFFWLIIAGGDEGYVIDLP